jgi:putative transposase
VSQTVSADFFTVRTIWFETLFVFVVLAHDRRRILHFNVTVHPTAEWTAHQIVEAFPFDSAPKYLLRDRDRIYGYEFRSNSKSWTSMKSSAHPDLPGNGLPSNG